MFRSKKLENGNFLTASGIEISADDAYDLRAFIEHESNVNDIKEEMHNLASENENFPEDFDADYVSNRLIETITKEYEAEINNSFDYSIVSDIVIDYEEKIISSFKRNQKTKANKTKDEIE